MEGLLKKFLEHVDLNKNGTPDMQEAHAFLDKYGPHANKFLAASKVFGKAGGFDVLGKILWPLIEKYLAPKLNAEAYGALKDMVHVATDAISK